MTRCKCVAVVAAEGGGGGGKDDLFIALARMHALTDGIAKKTKNKTTTTTNQDVSRDGLAY